MKQFLKPVGINGKNIFFAPYLIGIRWRYHSKSQDNTAYCTRLHSLTLEKNDFDVSGKIESSYSSDQVAFMARTFWALLCKNIITFLLMILECHNKSNPSFRNVLELEMGLNDYKTKKTENNSRSLIFRLCNGRQILVLQMMLLKS